MKRENWEEIYGLNSRSFAECDMETLEYCAELLTDCVRDGCSYTLLAAESKGCKEQFARRIPTREQLDMPVLRPSESLLMRT